MKKLILIAFSVLILQVVNAQETDIENKIILGGSFNFLSQNNAFPLSNLSINSGIGGIFINSANEARNTTFTISPYFGKEINPKLFIGLQLDYGLGRYRAEDVFVSGQANPVDFERNSNQIGIGFFTRHILNPTGKLSFFIQPYLEYNLLNEEQTQNLIVTIEEIANYFEIGVGLGLMYNINPLVRATLRSGGINYVNGRWEVKNSPIEQDFSSFRTNLDLSRIVFGLEVRL